MSDYHVTLWKAHLALSHFPHLVTLSRHSPPRASFIVWAPLSHIPPMGSSTNDVTPFWIIFDHDDLYDNLNCILYKNQVKKQPFLISAEPIRIESDFDTALARNLAVEILKSQQNKRKVEQQKLKSASEKSRSRLSSSDSFGNSWKSNFKSTSSANSQKSVRKVRGLPIMTSST